MVHKWFGEWGVFGREVVAGIVSHALPKFLAKGGEKVAEEAANKLFIDQRVLYFELIRQMEKAENFGSASVANLVRRREEAEHEHRENRFVTLLSKIVCDPVYGDDDSTERMRKQMEVLKDLNDLTDELFWARLAIVEHDVISQAVKRVRGQARPHVRRGVAKVKSFERWLGNRRGARR